MRPLEIACGLRTLIVAFWGLAPCCWPGWWHIDFSGVLPIALAEITRNARETPSVRCIGIRHSLLLLASPRRGRAITRPCQWYWTDLGGSRSVSSRIVADASG